MTLADKQISFIEDCYRLYEQKMYYVAFAILHNEEQAEDAVQDAFLKLMKHRVKFDSPRSDDCKRYIITVIRNAAINIYNRNKRDCEVTYLTDNIEIMESQATVLPGSESESDLQIEQIMGCLDGKYYDVVYCLVVRDMTARQAAEELGITEASVRKRFERAKGILRKHMNADASFNI